MGWAGNPVAAEVGWRRVSVGGEIRVGLGLRRGWILGALDFWRGGIRIIRLGRPVDNIQQRTSNGTQTPPIGCWALGVRCWVFELGR